MLSLSAMRRSTQRQTVEAHALRMADSNLITLYHEARGRVAAKAAEAQAALDAASSEPERVLAQKRMQLGLVRAVERERLAVLGAAVAACRRLAANSDWNLVPYPSQIEAAIAATDDSIVELATGEGKTLVAAMAAIIWALPATGVHLVTANGYLASRDAEWMRPLYESLGLTVASLDSTKPWSVERQAAYQCDVMYASVSEVGFDYLRDHTAPNAQARVQRQAWACLVDEADAVLIDDAGTPLILSGPSDDTANISLMHEANEIAQSLWVEQGKRVQRLVDAALVEWKAGNIELAAETIAAAMLGDARHPAVTEALSLTPGLAAVVEPFVQAKSTVESIESRQTDLLLAVDIDSKSTATTERGQEWLPEEWRDSDTPESEPRRHALMQAVRAHSLFMRDRDYLVDGNNISLIDQRTGRVLSGRRWSDGLHQAVEVKERIGNQTETRTVARCTIQSFFQRYSRLAGMTGTAKDASTEFASVYRCKVTHIPPHRASKRIDAPDMLFPTKADRTRAIVGVVRRLHSLELPVVVAAPTVMAAEEVARHITNAGLDVALLTARVPSEEAAIIARAGQPGAITVTTAMAGRGTDIVVADDAKINRSVEWCLAKGKELVLLPQGPQGEPSTESGGLHVLALGRWGSRRVDRQLKGRAGRQGEPGWTQTFVTAEDPLVLESGVSRTLALLGRLGGLPPEGAASAAVTRLLERAQRAVAVRDAEGRARTASSDAWLNMQRDMIYGLRDLLLDEPAEASDWIQIATKEGLEIIEKRLTPVSEFIQDELGEASANDEAQESRRQEAQALSDVLGSDPVSALAQDELAMRNAYGDVVIQQMACAAIDLWWGEHLAWYDAARASSIYQGATGGTDATQVLAERLDEAFESGRQDICVQVVRWFREKGLGLASASNMPAGAALPD